MVKLGGGGGETKHDSKSCLVMTSHQRLPKAFPSTGIYGAANKSVQNKLSATMHASGLADWYNLLDAVLHRIVREHADEICYRFVHKFSAIVMLENAWGAKNLVCPLHLQSHKV